MTSTVGQRASVWFSTGRGGGARRTAYRLIRWAVMASDSRITCGVGAVGCSHQKTIRTAATFPRRHPGRDPGSRKTGGVVWISAGVYPVSGAGMTGCACVSRTDRLLAHGTAGRTSALRRGTVLSVTLRCSSCIRLNPKRFAYLEGNASSERALAATQIKQPATS